jgi:hypothetical protein
MRVIGLMRHDNDDESHFGLFIKNTKSQNADRLSKNVRRSLFQKSVICMGMCETPLSPLWNRIVSPTSMSAFQRLAYREREREREVQLAEAGDTTADAPASDES